MRFVVTAAVTSLAVDTDRINPRDVTGEVGAVAKAGTNAGSDTAANDNAAMAMKP